MTEGGTAENVTAIMRRRRVFEILEKRYIEGFSESKSDASMVIEAALFNALPLALVQWAAAR